MYIVLQLSIMAQDRGYPPMNDRTTVYITVQRNLHSPVFTQEDYDISITENEPVQATVLTVTASDEDGVGRSVRFLNLFVDEMSSQWLRSRSTLVTRPF